MTIRQCLKFPVTCINRSLRLILGLIATYRLTGRFLPIQVRFLSSRMRLIVIKSNTAHVDLGSSVLQIAPWFENYRPVTICLGNNAVFRMEGDFCLGPNCRLSVGEKASLVLGGRQNESASGITENAIISVLKAVEIGKDFLGAWNLYITDADHHRYGESNPPIPVKIGNHVWMCPESSILKGVCIGSDSVVTTKALVLKGDYPPESLIGGVPAKRICSAKTWHR